MTDELGVVGVISLSRLERELAEDGDKQLGEILDPLAFPHVHSDQALDLALERMGVNQIELLPVVSRADVHDLKGIVMLQDVLDAYGISRTASNFWLAGGPFPRDRHPGSNSLENLVRRCRHCRFILSCYRIQAQLKQHSGCFREMQDCAL